MFSLMLFMFLFLLAFLAMYYYLLKKIDNNYRQLSEEHAQLRVLLRALESRMDKLPGQDEASGEFPKPVAEEDPAARDPLLHLSFEAASQPGKEFYQNNKVELKFPTTGFPLPEEKGK